MLSPGRDPAPAACSSENYSAFGCRGAQCRRTPPARGRAQGSDARGSPRPESWRPGFWTPGGAPAQVSAPGVLAPRCSDTQGSFRPGKEGAGAGRPSTEARRWGSRRRFSLCGSPVITHRGCRT